MGFDFLCTCFDNIFTSSSTHITLQCDPHEEGRLESAKEPVAGNDDFQVVSCGNLLRKIFMDSDENY